MPHSSAGVHRVGNARTDYDQGPRECRADFATKHSHYGGALDRASLVSALRAKDAETPELLAAVATAGASDYMID